MLCPALSSSGKERHGHTLQPEKEKAQRDLNKDYKFLKGGCKKDRARLFSELSSDRTRGNGHRMEQEMLYLNIRKYFYPSED